MSPNCIVMPDKEGSEDEKTTKGVVKKKQKQMMGEEGYDTYRDNILMRGGDHRSKETKEKSYTPSKQPKGQTVAQKAAKGKSALELVKADITKKYGKGAIMDVKKKSKKKANEELDLTKIAEAFGGYVVEANGKNGKKNGKKREDIDDFISAEDPFNVAKKQAEKDIKKTPVDPRFSGKEDEFASDTQSSKPQEKNVLRKKAGKPKPGSVKFTQRPGEAPVKITRDPSVIDPKFAKKKIPKPKVDVEDEQDYKKAAKSFKKDIGGEKIVSPTMQDRLEKATAGPRRARKRRSDAASFAQVKADIDMADAARKAKGKGEYASDYEKRLAKAYDKSLEGTVKTGRAPAGSPLPQAKTKTPQGQPQKGKPDSLVQAATKKSIQDFDARELSSDGASPDKVRKFNQQQNILRRLQRQGMADSGATPFKQPPLPDPKTGPSSKLTFSKFQQDQQKRFDQNKRDAEAADAYRKTPEYQSQAQGTDEFGNYLSPEERKRNLQIQKRGVVSPERKEAERKESEIKKNVKRDQSQIDPKNLDPDIDGFRRGRRGTLTRNRKSPNVDTMTDKISREVRDMADTTQMAQMSYMGSLGGLLTKTVSSSAAGAEAGIRYARGDKLGASLSALQGMGGGVGFAAGVANVIRSRRIAQGIPDPKIFGRKPKDFNKKFFDTDKKNRQLAIPTDPKKLAMAGAIGGAVIPQIRNALSKLPKGVPPLKGGRAGTRRARGGGGL